MNMVIELNTRKNISNATCHHLNINNHINKPYIFIKDTLKSLDKNTIATYLTLNIKIFKFLCNLLEDILSALEIIKNHFAFFWV